MRPTLRNSKLTPTVDLQKNMKYVAINVVFLIALRLSRKLENCLFPFYGEALGERQPSLRGERSSCMSPGGPSETSWGGSLLASSSFWKPQAFLTCGHRTSIFTGLPCVSVSQCLFSSYKGTSDIALRALPYCSMTSSYLEYICKSCIFNSDFIHRYQGLELLHICLRDTMLPITSLHSHSVLSYSLSSITFEHWINEQLICSVFRTWSLLELVYLSTQLNWLRIEEKIAIIMFYPVSCFFHITFPFFHHWHHISNSRGEKNPDTN